MMELSEQMMTPSPHQDLPEPPLWQLLRATAQQAGLTCIDDAWKGQSASYTFACGRGHVAVRKAKQFLSAAGDSSTTASIAKLKCRTCAREDDAVAFAEIVAKRSGVSLEPGFLGREAYHRLRCAQGHEWRTKGSATLKGAWCVTCAPKQAGRTRSHADGLARLQAAAERQGGRCLSTPYTIMDTRYEFVCAAGHTWQALGAAVLRGQWCARCKTATRSAGQKRPDGLRMLQEIAISRGGVCLASEYRGLAHDHRFRCARGHEWDAKATETLRGVWCRACFFDDARLGIEKMRAVAHERGGLCLSDAYVNSHSKLEWQCHRGHVWRASAGNVLHLRSWCPMCAYLDRTLRPHKRKRYLVE